MIERIDEKLKLLIDEILNKKVLLMTHDDYLILQDCRWRKISEEQQKERDAAWKEEMGMMMGLLNGVSGLNGGGSDDVH